MNTFTKSVDLLHRTMDANALRYQVTANNLVDMKRIFDTRSGEITAK